MPLTGGPASSPLMPRVLFVRVVLHPIVFEQPPGVLHLVRLRVMLRAGPGRLLEKPPGILHLYVETTAL